MTLMYKQYVAIKLQALSRSINYMAIDSQVCFHRRSCKTMLMHYWACGAVRYWKFGLENFGLWNFSSKFVLVLPESCHEKSVPGIKMLLGQGSTTGMKSWRLLLESEILSYIWLLQLLT